MKTIILLICLFLISGCQTTSVHVVNTDSTNSNDTSTQEYEFSEHSSSHVKIKEQVPTKKEKQEPSKKVNEALKIRYKLKDLNKKSTK